MSDTLYFSATEARQNFFELLRLAKAGKKITINKQDEDIMFELNRSPKTKKNIIKIAKDISNLGLTAVPLDKMTKILEESHSIEIE